MFLDLILCGIGDVARGIAVTEQKHPGFIPWIFLSAIGAGVIAAIAAGIGFMFSDTGKEKETAKSAGAIVFVILMIISVIVFFAQ